MHETLSLLAATDFAKIRRNQLDILQVNLGYKCNQRCLHCHVNASPERKEMMTRDTVELVIEVLARRNIKVLDLTGGAPELNDNFRMLVREARRLGVQVIDRCNLTILFEPGQETLAEFLASHHVDITASLPCYSLENVDAQRGDGVFDKSIDALKLLNSLGYGSGGRFGAALNLVYNPQGATLPPPQGPLEQDYKRELKRNYGIVFDNLFVITNMPIKRFGSTLVSKGKFDEYMALLRSAYQVQNLQTVMCRTLLSVDWQGRLYDCDFNQMLGMGAQFAHNKRPTLQDLLEHDPENEAIQIANHCYGCTAGQGSSCGGALGEEEVIVLKKQNHG